MNKEVETQTILSTPHMRMAIFLAAKQPGYKVITAQNVEETSPSGKILGIWTKHATTHRSRKIQSLCTVRSAAEG
jgi:hypothetical protein